MEILAKLGINWTLLIAQIVNFAIITGVLMYFVYKPILRLLDERRDRIKKSMDEVARIENQAKELEELRRIRLSEADKEAGKMLEMAKEEAEKMRQELLHSARREAEAIIAKGQTKLAEDRRKVFEEAQGTLSALIIRMTEKILEREFKPADQKRLLTLLEKEISSTQV